jgi:hypothetical protein
MTYPQGLAIPDDRLAIGLLFLGTFLGACILLRKIRTLRLTAVFLTLGYIGAGLFYGYLLGFDSQTPLSCPLCPDIDGRGRSLTKFVLYSLISGTVNAVCVAASGWLIVGLLRSARRWRNTGTVSSAK